jgi:hypothetical protein
VPSDTGRIRNGIQIINNLFAGSIPKNIIIRMSLSKFHLDTPHARNFGIAACLIGAIFFVKTISFTSTENIGGIATAHASAFAQTRYWAL